MVSMVINEGGLMRKMVLLISLLFLVNTVFAEANSFDVYLFYGRGCPHCAALMQYLDSISDEYPNMRLHLYEVYFNQKNRELFGRMAEAYNTEIQGVPTLFVDDKVIVGYAPSMQAVFRQVFDKCSETYCSDPIKRLESSENRNISISVSESSPVESKEKLTLPLVIGAASVDAINPCAFAVLILLMSTVLASSKRRKALFSGLSFSAAVYMMYFLMGIGIFTAIQLSGLSELFMKFIGVLALIVGVFNIKDFIKLGALGFVMEVPLSWRPKMQAFIKSITSVPGAFLIGCLVSLFLLPCTSGPYIVILGMLANQSTQMQAVLWLLLYNFIFILPMIGITLAIYWGLSTPESAAKWREKKLRYLHLIAGIVMIAMGLIILFML
ncbi:hypothetical protein DRN74_02690 [Candidatus Micrarchaeota archaeon]|nr:MAG: hypothetical protein DRN74_02690 [Candidatus Micrarchaeota archaeon]